MEQIIDRSAVHEVGADQSGEDDRAWNGFLGGLGKAQQQVAGNNNFATNATALYDPSSGRTNPQALPYTGDNFANFYLGVANYSNQYVRGMFYARAKEFAGYFQDKYRVSQRLTLNLGLRYEYWPPFRAKNNAVVSFDKANQAIVLGSTLQQLEIMGYTTASIVAREPFTPCRP